MSAFGPTERVLDAMLAKADVNGCQRHGRAP